MSKSAKSYKFNPLSWVFPSISTRISRPSASWPIAVRALWTLTKSSKLNVSKLKIISDTIIWIKKPWMPPSSNWRAFWTLFLPFRTSQITPETSWSINEFLIKSSVMYPTMNWSFPASECQLGTLVIPNEGILVVTDRTKRESLIRLPSIGSELSSGQVCRRSDRPGT